MKLHFNCVALVMIFQNCGGKRGAQFETPLKSLNSWKTLSTDPVRFESNHQRSNWTVQNKETLVKAPARRLFSDSFIHTLLTESQTPNCYQQLSQGFAVLLNGPLDSSSTSPSNISEPHFRSALCNNTTTSTPGCQTKKKPTGSHSYWCT